MTSPASYSPETTTNASGLLACGPNSNSSSLSPDGGVSQLHSLHQQTAVDMTSPLCTAGGAGGNTAAAGGGVCSTNNWLQQENDYFKELAELLHENLSGPDMLQGVNNQALREMIRQLQQLKDAKKENAIQHGDVSSSGPTLLASHIGPMLLEALDGFFFVMNTDGFVEFVSQNVQKYLKYNQADMLNKPIYNFLASNDHDLFSRLLPDSLGWNLLSINSPTSGRERRSHTFMCRFLVNPEEKLQQGQYSTSSQYEHLQVSAISLPYPNSDIQREMDEFLSFAPIADSQPCLVCVARRVSEVGNGTGENTSSSAAFISQRSNATAGSGAGGGLCGKSSSCSNQTVVPSGLQEGLQFSLICSLESLEILSIDCKDTTVKQLLAPKDAQAEISGRLRTLCHPSDLPLLESHIRNVLERGNDCLSQIRMYLPSSMAVGGASGSPNSPAQSYSRLLFLQARSQLVGRAESVGSPSAVQLDFTLLRVTDAASSSSSALSSPPFQGTNSSSGILPSSDPVKSHLPQQADFNSAPSSTLFDTNVSSQSVTNTDFISSSYGDAGQSHGASGNNAATFDLFLDMQFDCLQTNGFSPSSTQQQQFDAFGRQQQQQTPGNCQFPTSTTSSPSAPQQHNRRPSSPRKAVSHASRCPSALSEPVSSTAGALGGLDAAGQDDLQRLCSIFFDDPVNDGQSGSPAGPIVHQTSSDCQPQQQTTFSPCHLDPVKAELASPSMCQQQNQGQHGDMNILKNLLTQEEQERRRQQEGQQRSCQHTADVQTDQKPNLHDMVAFQQPNSLGNGAGMTSFPGPAFTPMNSAVSPAQQPAQPIGKGAKGGRRGGAKANANGTGGRRNKKGQQQQRSKSMIPVTAEQSPVLEQLLRPEMGGPNCGYAIGPNAGNQAQMQILQSLLQEDDCGNGSASPNVPNSRPLSAKTPVSYSPAFGAGQNYVGSPAAGSPYASTPATTPNGRKRRGSSYSNLEKSMARSAISPSNASLSGISPVGHTDQMANTNPAHGPPPAKQSTSLLVQLLEQAAPQTRTLPTSIASSPLDKLAKENKENPNKPRVSTVLVETLLTRPRTSTPVTGSLQHSGQPMPTHATGGGPSFASPYVPTPPMFLQCQGGGGGQGDYEQVPVMYQPAQQPYPMPQSHAQMYQQQSMDQQQQFLDSQHYSAMVAGQGQMTRPTMGPSTAPGGFPPQAQPRQTNATRSGRQHRQPGGANVRHQLLLQQQQKRGKQQHAPAVVTQQQMLPNQFQHQPHQSTPRPPPYPGVMPTAMPNFAANSQPPQQSHVYQQAVANFRPHLPHPQSVPPVSTVQQQQQQQQHSQQLQAPVQVYNYDPSSARYAVSPMGQFVNSPLSPQLSSPPGVSYPFYTARMPQPASVPANVPPPLAPSDVVRHELRQAVQNRAQMHQQQQAALMNQQQLHQMHQPRPAPAWQRSQSTPGTVDRRPSKDFGSPGGQHTMTQHHMQPHGSPLVGQTGILQQQLLSPPPPPSNLSSSSSGPPPTDPSPTAYPVPAPLGATERTTFDSSDHRDVLGNDGGGMQPGNTGNLEASWNFDLGFENGLDMDDESTRSFLQQLLN